MHSALYYPFTGPSRSTFLKTALFLWDSVDFIVPNHEFHLHGKDKEQDEAMEIIGRSYVPTDEDKRSMHNELEMICASLIPSRFAFELETPGNLYSFYPEKLHPETWQMLKQSKLAEITSADGDVLIASTGPLFGYYMMSLLAVCCSQGQKRLVTDHNDPYHALANIMVDESAGSNSSKDWHGTLLALTLDGPNFSDVPLSRLIDIRKQDDKLLQDLRREFLKKVDTTASEISANANNPNTVRDRIEDFTDSVEKDLKDLKKALGRSGLSLLLSKEFGVSVLAATSVALEPITGALFTIGGLTRGLIEYQDRRRKILRDNSSSWLFATCGPKAPLA